MSSQTEALDALVVGGGFAGVFHLYRLRQLGHHVKLFDAAPDFGGIWRLNCYPGARVDSELPLYGLSIPEVYRTWNWSERYPSFKELRAYFDHMGESTLFEPIDLGSRSIFFMSQIKCSIYAEIASSTCVSQKPTGTKKSIAGT